VIWSPGMKPRVVFCGNHDATAVAKPAFSKGSTEGRGVGSVPLGKPVLARPTEGREGVKGTLTRSRHTGITASA
jgi:hypothetical protein